MSARRNGRPRQKEVHDKDVTDEQERAHAHEEEAVGDEVVVDFAGVDDGVGDLDQLDADLGNQADGELANAVIVAPMIDQFLPGLVRRPQQTEDLTQSLAFL